MDTITCLELRACRGAPVLATHDGEQICGACGKRKERHGKVRRPRVTSFPKTPAIGQGMAHGRVAEALIVSGKSDLRHGESRGPGSNSDTPTLVEEHDCTTCSRGKIGKKRWEEGVRLCTRCAPLPLVSVGVHKSIPALMLPEDATPERVASGRRRS